MKYKIIGDNLQLVNIELEDKESIYAETGKFVYKSENVNIEAKIKGGLKEGLKRLFTQESFFIAEFTSNGKGLVGFGPDLPGKIKPIILKANQSFIAERGAFLCAEDKVKIDIHTTKIGAGIFGGEGIFLQQLMGPGIVFINVSGDLIEYNLDENQTLEVFKGHLVGFDPSVSYDVRYVGSIKTAVFGGAGLMLIKLKGPGKVILQSMTPEKINRVLGVRASSSGGINRSNSKNINIGDILSHIPRK